MKRVLWWLLAGSRGGANRADILFRLKERPFNAHQLADACGLDYKTVRHHLRVLEDNQCIAASGKDQYGAMYFLTAQMEQNWPVLEEIWSKIRPAGATHPTPSHAGGGSSGPPAGGPGVASQTEPPEKGRGETR
ncbi:MAG: ArsR/SmtB family transcription factor [Thermoplasmatota archaeon]